MDALSDVLSLLRVSALLSSRLEGRGSWAFEFPAYQHVKFGGVVSGRLYLQMQGEAVTRVLEEGDFYLLTNGHPFCLASDPALAPVDGIAALEACRGSDGVIRFGSEGDAPPCTLTSGRFTFENDAADLLLRHLPPLIHLRAPDSASQALGHLLQLLAHETGDLQPGAVVARDNLAALVLVHGLRAHLASHTKPKGWLAALADAKIGAALARMHGQPGERWTVEGLARCAGMSRTAFATRFRDLVGQPPLEYLGQWRMTIAKKALHHSDESLVEIASRIGYLSDTAFSIAFKRWTGQSPGRFRAARRAAALA